MPKDEPFFDWFERNAEHLVEGAQTLVQALEQPERFDEAALRLTDLEQAADEVTHQITAGLNRTFVTPLDREDIAALANALDDVLDVMDVALRRMALFKLRDPSPVAQQLARVVLGQAEAIHQAVPALRRKREMAGLQGSLVEINRLENEADRLLERALANLFADDADLPSLVHALKWKEVYELLETATDRAEDVADVIESIVLKHG
jgi:predicted phosphate transport protein (TIGR00153 family)